MNVLYIATYEGLSGASYSLLGMIDELRKNDVNPLVILLKDGKFRPLLEEKNIPYMIVRGYPWVIAQDKKRKIKQRVLWMAKCVFNARAEYTIDHIIQEKNIDLIHINASTAAVGFKASKRNHIPCIWHIREFVEEDLGKEFWNKSKAMKFLGMSSCAVAISSSVKDKFEKQSPGANIEVVYNGIPTKEYAVKRSAPIFSDKVIRIVIAGRIDPGKGHKELLLAMKKLSSFMEIESVILQIVGKSQSEAYEQEIVDLVNESGLSSKVEFLGYRNDLPEIYKKADIAIIASKAEAFGRVTVEAMMAGTLVIGADTAGTKEIIGSEYGLLYRQGSEDDLAEKILFALRNKSEMREIAEQGRQYALMRFSAKNNADEIYRIYMKLTSAKT